LDKEKTADDLATTGGSQKGQGEPLDNNIFTRVGAMLSYFLTGRIDAL